MIDDIQLQISLRANASRSSMYDRDKFDFFYDRNDYNKMILSGLKRITLMSELLTRPKCNDHILI